MFYIFVLLFIRKSTKMLSFAKSNVLKIYLRRGFLTFKANNTSAMYIVSLFQKILSLRPKKLANHGLGLSVDFVLKIKLEIFLLFWMSIDSYE